MASSGARKRKREQETQGDAPNKILTLTGKNKEKVQLCN